MNRVYYLLSILAAMLTIACGSSDMEAGFKSPSERVQTAVYWYWISGNISKEGVVEDLKAMKRAGINRAFIGDIGQDGLYTERNVKIFSDEWWEVLHTALKTASELDIEIGIFNSPGWSQSGGPWVNPEQAMRYLTSSTVVLEGQQSVEIDLTPEHIKNDSKLFQHVKTIAYPAPKGWGEAPAVEIKIAEGGAKDISKLAAGKRNVLLLNMAEKAILRSLTLQPAGSPILCKAQLDAEVDGEWKRVADFNIDRSNPALNVGFEPYAPVTVSFAAVECSRMRLTLEPSSQMGGFSDVTLSAQPRIASYAEKSLAKMCQTPLPYWDHYMWPEQAELDDKACAIDPKRVIDISGRVDADGVLRWNVPNGKWVVLHTGMTPTGVTNSPATPEATGLEIDKMSSAHVKSHFDAYIGEILRRIPAEDRRTFKVVVQDSYETGGQNFTDDMIAKFQSTYGYSMIPYLPAYYGMVVGDEQISDRFLWDLRRFIADRVAYEYVGGLKQVSNEHGLTTWLECYGHWGFPGEFLQYGGRSDEIGGEFWSVGELGDIENRAASSCGHIYGKRRIWAESNTSGGPAYSRSPIDMKQRTDRFFAEGINATLLHLYIQQADTNRYPGINAWFGNEFDGHNTWYTHLDLFTTYLKRCNYMLQQGLNIADVAYLIGEDAPKMTGMQHPVLPKGYQFDYINAEVLMVGANVANNNIVLPHGTSYRVLVLPPVDNMRPELLEKIKHMVGDGAIVLGQPPHRSPSLQNYPVADTMVEQMARELWGDCYDKRGVNKYGKGMVFNGYSLEELFAEIELVPDCQEPEPSLLFCHRSTMGAEIYFVSNQSNRPITITPTFRVSRRLLPEFWNPLDGSIRTLHDYEFTDSGTKISLELDALGSGFVVFRVEPSVNILSSEYSVHPVRCEEIRSEWAVSFDGKLSNPNDITMSKLRDLSTIKEDDIRYFSGTINYTTEIEPKFNKERVVLDFSKVECMAKVYINDEFAGGVWCEPYKVDITKRLQPGVNTLRVEVVNKWVNRIVGDMQLPEQERKISLTANPYNANSKIPSSGLIGPVRLEYYARLP